MNFSMGIPTTTAANPALKPVATTTATKNLFSLTTAKTTTSAATTAIPAATTFTLSTTSAPAVAPTFSLPTTSAPAKTEPAKFNIPSTTAPATTSVGFSLGGTAAPGTETQVPPVSSMTYSQVEDLLNKWTAELAEQENLFHEQVSQVNSWDRILSDNSNKLSKLHSTIEKVQQQQKKINYDLDFVLQQQKELENTLAPLEKEYSSSNYHPDVQRERMYQTAENIDAQIKKMSEEVKETIELVNEAAPSSQEKSHPIQLIGRVLNAHMNTLQWVDENSAQLQAQVESMSRYLDHIKRETDHRSYAPFQ